jgi:deoxyribodipyrimidine photo-lyase
MSTKPIIVWLRRDLRLQDNPALLAAAATDAPLILLFISGPDEDRANATGAASRWWLHHSLKAFARALAPLRARLCIRRGHTRQVLGELCASSGCGAVYFNRRYETAGHAIDQAVAQDLDSMGVNVRRFAGNALLAPGAISTQSGSPFRVFTPWYKRLRHSADVPPPAPAPTTFRLAEKVAGLELDDLDLLPSVNWYGGLEAAWTPGEAGAQAAVEAFHPTVGQYGGRRDTPSDSGTSRLSPHLHFGEITARQIWHRIGAGHQPQTAEDFRRQLGWRDFAIQLLWHFPETVEQPMAAKFSAFPWRRDSADLHAWQRGQTGYPLVDAGMRQLWQTGWMHNRVRMVVGSFLVKHLLIDWRAGASWFADTLVDADLANNTMGWQWIAGCGADAAPYFRIFNPIRQSQRFDGAGAYIRRWVPELKALDNKSIHAPWEMPVLLLYAAGVRLGVDYPRPIVDHQTARIRALDAYSMIK